MILRANGHPACDSRIRKSAHPDPTPAKEAYFPFSTPSPPTQHQDLHRAPAGRPPPRLAFSTTERGDELRKSEQVKIGGPVLGGAKQGIIPASLRSWGSGRSPHPLPYLTSTNRSLPPIGPHLLPSLRGSIAHWVSVSGF